MGNVKCNMIIIVIIPETIRRTLDIIIFGKKNLKKNAVGKKWSMNRWGMT